jgi:hypothetical protein
VQELELEVRECDNIMQLPGKQPFIRESCDLDDQNIREL